jgi:aspartate/methionine/tyrosine aminotransferase
MNRSLVSNRAQAVDASGIRKVFDLAAKLKDPINLSIGLPDFDVPDVAKLAAIDAIKSGRNAYTQTQGIAPLRERLRADLSKSAGTDVGDVLITSGVSGGLLLAMLACLDIGDEVVFLDPYFVMYRHLCTMIGVKPIVIDSYPDFRFPAEKVAAAITPRTKMLLLNSPSNPTGTILSAPEIDAAVAIARKHDLLILSDEIYEPFFYGSTSGLPSPYPAYDKTVVLRGFSKSHAMTGWRLGYAYGYEPVVSQMTKMQQYTYVCAPSPLQWSALKAMDVPMEPFVKAYQMKRDIVVAGLAGKFELVTPGGAFYAFPKVPGEQSAAAFCARAAEHNVLVIPGNVFSGRDTHLRISYATTDEKLKRGCEILCEIA